MRNREKVKRENIMKNKRAYVSVYNKEGIVEFCRYLEEYGYELIATEGTQKVLSEAGIKVISAHDLTGYPEPLGGKVRAVHPAIYTGIIANRFTPAQLAELDSEDVYPIELVIVNLYPFKEDMEAGVPFEEAAAHIDAGGVALLDAAAKNFQSTVAVCDPADYERILCDLAAGVITDEERRYFMYKAFSCTASYDALVAQYLSRHLKISFPQNLTVTYEKAQEMRYGENPHQKAAIYREPLLKEGSLARAKQLAGPVMTYNNFYDANAALELVKEFDQPAAVICKHRAPCGAGVGESVYDAFLRAADADPLHCQNGIIAINGVVDTRLALELKEREAELILAVGFTPEAMTELRYRENLILLEMPGIRSKVQFSTFDLQKIYGGLLVQSYDTLAGASAYPVTKRKPTEKEIRALNFCYKVVKHARSSAVVLGKENQTVGIGTGQIHRLLALQFAIELAEGNTKGCVLASDADLPTSMCAELCHNAGITAIILTGNCSEEFVALCDKYKIAVLCTRERHFKS